jgi:hypothetical protein
MDIFRQQCQLPNVTGFTATRIRPNESAHLLVYCKLYLVLRIIVRARHKGVGIT